VEHNDRILTDVSRQALANIGEHAPEGSVIVEAVVVCRMFAPDGTVAVVTDHVPRGGWKLPAGDDRELPDIADTMIAEADKLRPSLDT
jgi:hypothetical protein